MLLERLQESNPALEYWWDSLPGAYAPWRSDLLARTPSAQRAAWAARLDRFFDPTRPSAGLARGATSNPRLVLASLERERDAWAPLLDALAHEDLTPDERFARLRAAVFRHHAGLLRGLWDATGGAQGWVCAQLSPTLADDADALVREARALAAIAPNVMIKVAANAAGLDAIERLCALGIAVNSTLSFTTAQVLAVARAIARGRAASRAAGPWRAVITYMAGRLGAEPALREEARARGLTLDDATIRWGEVAVGRGMQAALDEGGYPATLLVCSLAVDADAGCLHLEQLGQARCVVTLPPSTLEALLALPAARAPVRREVPRAALAQLRALPYFRAAEAPDGLAPEDFGRHPAFVRALGEALRAHQDTLALLASAERIVH